MKMKFVKRHNIIYPLMIIVFLSLRYVDIFVMNNYIDESKNYILLPFIMFLSEFISGLFFFIYFSKKNKAINKTGSTKKVLIYQPNTIDYPDSVFKIYLLLFMGSYFDFNISSTESYYFYKYRVSPLIDLHAKNILTLINSLLCFFLLRIKIHKHQLLSLIIIFTCFIIVVISEICFEIFKEEKYNYIKHISIIIVNNIFNSFLDVIEKYLLEVDYMNPFEILMIEGIFGLFFTIIFAIYDNFFSELKDGKINKNIITLIICLVIYFITSAGRNLYRLITNKLYSPMVRTLTDSFLNPFLIIYYYFGSKDLKNAFLFVTNFIASSIIVFFGCVYNEFLILFCCNLDHETYHNISERAIENDIENYYELPSSHIEE